MISSTHKSKLTFATLQTMGTLVLAKEFASHKRLMNLKEDQLNGEQRSKLVVVSVLHVVTITQARSLAKAQKRSIKKW